MPGIPVKALVTNQLRTAEVVHASRKCRTPQSTHIMSTRHNQLVFIDELSLCCISYLPEPDNLRCLWGAMFQPGIIAPVMHIYAGDTSDDQFQLSLVKRTQEMIWYQFTESYNVV